MNCPKCRAALIVLELNGVEIDHCFQCGGVWFDAGELDKLLEGYAHKAVWFDELKPTDADKEQAIRCPVCHKKMEKICWPLNTPIIIDQCRRGDGLWFDNGELAALVRNQNSDRTQNDPVADLLEEIFKKL